MKYQTLESKAMYQGKAFGVRHDQVRLPDGNVAQLDIVVHVGAVTILPLDDQDRILFVRQYRHPAGQELLELPAGTLEPGEPPEACASREIREEVGQAAGVMRKLGEFFLAPGYSTEYMHIFFATELHPDPLPGDHDEFICVEAYSREEIFRMVENGEIKDAKTLAALMLSWPILSQPWLY